MTNPQSTPEAVVWVAIDVAKDRHEALIEAPGWKSRKKFQVQNTAEEFRALAGFLHRLGWPVRIGFEPTGNYHRALAYFLHSEGFHLELISSLALARTREAMHNSWEKNDPKDAQVILHLLKAGLTQHYHDPLVHNLNDLQELSKSHHHVSLEKTRTQHRLLTHYLPLYFPEIARYHSSSRSQWLWNLLIEFPTPQSMTRLSKAEFVRRAWPLVGRKVAKERILSDVYLTAQASVGLPVEQSSETVVMLRFVLHQLVTLCQLRDTIENRADALLHDEMWCPPIRRASWEEQGDRWVACHLSWWFRNSQILSWASGSRHPLPAVLLDVHSRDCWLHRRHHLPIDERPSICGKVPYDLKS